MVITRSSSSLSLILSISLYISNLEKAGANVFHAGKIGNDGLFIKKLLQGFGVKTDFLAIEETVTKKK